MGLAAKARADGYTILLALSSLTVIPEADAMLNRAPMFALSDLRPIARFTADPTVLAVRSDAPWKTVQDLIDDARKRPGAINYGSSGNYGTMHVPMEILSQTAGVKMTHVPFTGAGPALVALLGGQIDAISSGPATVLQHIKAGKLRVLAHWGNGRLAAMPDVPSIKDSGFNVEYAQWSGLFIPQATPEPVAQRLRVAARPWRRASRAELFAVNAQQLNFKQQCGVGRNHAPGAAFAIGDGCGAGQLGFAAHLHALHAFGPAFDDAVQGELDGLVAFVGAVKFAAIGEGAAVVHLDLVAGRGAGAIAVLERAVHQTAGGDHGAGFLGRGRAGSVSSPGSGQDYQGGSESGNA